MKEMLSAQAKTTKFNIFPLRVFCLCFVDSEPRFPPQWEGAVSIYHFRAACASLVRCLLRFGDPQNFQRCSCQETGVVEGGTYPADQLGSLGPKQELTH